MVFMCLMIKPGDAEMTNETPRHDHQDCIFCKIIAGTVPCLKLYEDERVLAFLDINPIHPGHTLIVPKSHSANLLELPSGDVAAILPVAQLIGSVVMDELKPDGFNLHQANGAGAGQSVFHFHMHVIPRRFDDGVVMNWPLVPGDRAELQAVAERMRAALRQRMPA
jgi:histidine triad (HIT) family protein